MTLTADDIRLLQDGVRGCLAGATLGDALGMPWETYARQLILELTGQAGVTGLQDLPAGYERKYPDSRGFKLSDTTDDWQLTKVVADSLIRSQGFNVYDQALAHVRALEQSTHGWGGTTRHEVKQLKLWFDSRGEKGRRPDVEPQPREGRGNGNGVIMKVSPLACAAALLKQGGRSNQFVDLLAQWVMALNRLTHGHDAGFSALMVANVMCRTFEFTQLSPKPHELLNCLGNVKMSYYLLMRDISRPGPSGPNTRALENFLLNEDRLLAQQINPESQALPTMMFVISTFLRHPTDFRAAVLEAINAGGDTDTNASIVGALVGANVGLSGIPPEWIQAVPDAKEAITVADDLVRVFLNS